MPNEILCTNNNIISEICSEIIDANDINIQDKVILAPKNVDVISINNEIL